MSETKWYRTGWAAVAGSLLFPPAGLVLVWMRPSRWFWKVAATPVILILAVVHLFAVYGFQMELAGSGLPGFFGFIDPAERIEALEAHRSAMMEESADGAAVATPVSAATSSAETNAVSSTAAPLPAPGDDQPELSAHWIAFRGPNRDGVYDQTSIKTVWPAEGLTPLWKQPVGGGYASFTVAHGAAFTIEQRRDSEVVVSYDIRTGRELWTHSWKSFFQEPMGGDGPRSTPTWDDGRLYALGATGELHCLDATTGALLWKRNILTDAGVRNIEWGMAASPLVVDGKVIVQPGGTDGASVVAYDKLTGDPVWKSLSDKQAYTSPVVVTLAGQRQLLVVSAERIIGMTVEDGRHLWSHPWTTMYGINSAQPIIVDDDHVFVSAGYDHGSILLNITRDGDSFTATPVWENRKMKNRFNSSVLHEGNIYGFDEFIFACIDARTGERCWKGGRYGYGQVLLASGHLIVLTERGELVLLRATPEQHEEIARFQAIEGKTWNAHAISDGILLIRNAQEMAAFRLN